MKKKLVSCILVVCMLLTMLPTMAWAEEAKVLYIDDGSITITDAGWTQGTATGTDLAVTISGTATTANTITVNGGNPTITFSGLNIKRDNDNSSSVPVLTVNSDATIKLDGTNTIDSTAANTNNANIRTNIITIAANATLTVDGSGSLDITAGLIHGNNGTSPVKGEGTFKMVSGTVYVSSSGTNPALGCAAAELLGGSLTLSATGHSTTKALVVENLTISGGELDVTGRAGGIEVTNFTMSGGIIEKITVTSGKPAFSATNVSITGGNVNGYYTGDVNGRTPTKLQVNGDNYLPLIDTAIEMDEYDENGTKLGTLKAITNSSGLIYTYLANNTTTLKYKDVTYNNVTPGTDVVLGSQLPGKTFNIGAGAITFADGTYTQNGVGYTPETVTEEVYIVGSGVTDNYLEVTSGTANVILNSVNLDDKTNGGSDDANGMIRVTGGTLNLTLKGENTFTRHRGSLIFVGSVTDPANAGAAVLNIDCAEDSDCTNETCPHSLKLTTGNARSAAIGAARNFDVDGDGTIEENEKQVDMAGTININGGEIIINGGDTGIGTIDGAAESHYDINITGGYVDITTSASASAVGIGMGRNNSPGSEVNIKIIDGTVKVINPAEVGANENAITPVAIGAAYKAEGELNITIGSEETEPAIIAKCENGVAIGKGASGDNSGTGVVHTCTTMSIDIVGGDVTATGIVGIGYNSGAVDSDSGSTISISGGKVTASGTQVGIGVGTPAPNFYDNTIGRNGSCNLSIDISDDAEVKVSGGSVGIGVDEMVSGATVDIAVSDNAKVEATATSENGVAIGSTKFGDEADYTTETTIEITSPNMTLSATKPIAASAEGTVTAEGGITINGTTLPEDVGTVTIPVDKVDEVAVDANGTVSLPADSTITKEDGSSVNLSEGGTMAADGAITAGGTVTTKDAQGNVVSTVVVPEGKDATVSADGKVTAPAGTVVTDKDGKENTLTNGGTVSADGTVKKNSYGYYIPSTTPTVTPSVDSSSLNNAAQAVGSAINNGSAELEPATGYTEADIAKLMKEGKLKLSIEKKSGYTSAAEKDLIDAAIKKAGGAVSGTVVMYFDITPVLKTDDGKVVANVTDTEKPIAITVELSAALQKAAKDGKQIAVVRCHDGKTTFLDTKLNAAKTKITFSSADFSTYAVVALEKQTSAQTFDAGIVVYAGMAVLAATGSAVVIGKKRK